MHVVAFELYSVGCKLVQVWSLEQPFVQIVVVSLVSWWGNIAIIITECTVYILGIISVGYGELLAGIEHLPVDLLQQTT